MLRSKSWMIVLAAAMLGAGSAQAQIKVGITMSASGPGAALGQPQSKTVAALPKEIAGQKITYFALDDEVRSDQGSAKRPQAHRRGKGRRADRLLADPR